MPQMPRILLVPTKVLIAIAGVVWLAAGCSVSYVGVTALKYGWTLPVFIAYLILLALFFIMFFRITGKHIRRIVGYTEELKGLYHFFNAQTYIVIAIMIFLGFAIRMSGFVPAPAIAALYTAIGTALILCSVYYIVTFIAKYEGFVYKKK